LHMEVVKAPVCNCKGEIPDKNPGLDHGVGHPLLLLDDAKAHRGRNSNYFNGL
jgi:hypothetical protein